MMSIFENIRIQLEAELLRWNQKEELYQNEIQELRELNDYLKKEIESLEKQLTELRNNEKKLTNENKKLQTEMDVIGSIRHRQRWRFFF